MCSLFANIKMTRILFIRLARHTIFELYWLKNGRLNGGLTVAGQFDALVESGLVLYDSEQTIVEYVENDLKFQFLLTSALTAKPGLQTSTSQFNGEQQNEAKPRVRAGSDINTDGFEISFSGGENHFVAANKFCFARPHLLLLTSDGHRKEYEALVENDFEAAWNALQSLKDDYTVFFNCGKNSGCSRLHKHMQIMPTPANSFASFLDIVEAEEPKVSFQWFYRRFESGQMTPASLTGIYSELLEQATAAAQGRSNEEHEAVCPHNFIFTKRWMLVIPRRRPGINKEAGVNAMGIIGVIAVATRKEIERWVSFGLTTSLRELGVSRS